MVIGYPDGNYDTTDRFLKLHILYDYIDPAHLMIAILLLHYNMLR